MKRSWREWFVGWSYCLEKPWSGGATISLDNQAAIQALDITDSRQRHYLIDSVHNKYGLLHAKHGTIKLTIQWVPGHMHGDIEGNEVAAGVAKTAAKALKEHPLINIALVKKEFKIYASAEAGKRFSASPRYAAVTKVDPSLPSTNFWKITNNR
ncbi:hypothetical protein BU17DRAFT_94743 [Hysterangium stoloniferum]|nr:hypothetical protein BU17DRAFT_94743 [Hysterangium stoloniferum]